MSDLLPQPSDLLPLLPGAGVGAAAIGLATWIRRPTTREVIAAAGVVGALFVTWWNLHGTIPWPPSQSTERTLWSAVGWTLAAILAAAARKPATRGIAILAGIAVGLGLVRWILHPLVERDSPDRIDAALWCSLGAVVGTLAPIASAGLARLPALAGPIALSIAIGGAGQVMFLFGSASLAQLIGCLAMMAGIASALTLGKRAVPPAMASAVIGVTALLLVDGYGFLDATPPVTVFAFLTAAALAPWAAALPGPGSSTARNQALWVWFVAIAMAGAAVAIAFDHAPAPDPYDDLYK